MQGSGQCETCRNLPFVLGVIGLRFFSASLWAEAPNLCTFETKQSTWAGTFVLVVVSGSSLSRLKAEAALVQERDNSVTSAALKTAEQGK